MATIKDIAELAGVSPAAVSRVLNYDEEISVSQDTRRKIFEAAEQLNYTKHMKKNRGASGEKILLLQWYDESEEFEDLYYLSIRLGIEKKCQELHIDLTRQFLNVSQEVAGDISAVIALGKFDETQMKFFQQLTVPVLFVDFDGLSQGFPSLVVDFEGAVENLLSKAIEEGESNFGIMTGIEKTMEEKINVEDKRFIAFRDFLLSKNLYQEKFVYESLFTVESAYEKMVEILQRQTILPKFLFCSSDAIAIGVLKALQEAGKKVPDEMKVVGFNDSSVAKYVTPSLSTIKVHTEWMGEQSVNFALQLLQEEMPVPQKIVVGTTFIRRQSY